MLQNQSRVFLSKSKSFFLSKSRVSLTSKLNMLSSTRSFVNTRYNVLKRFTSHQCTSEARFTLALSKLLHRTCRKLPSEYRLGPGPQSILSHQTIRALSTTQYNQAVFSKHSGNNRNPPKANLIYTGPLTNMVKLVKLFSLSTSGISALILSMLFMTDEPGALKIIGGSMAALILLTPIVLHWITKSYVTEIYYDRATDTYTSYTVSFLLSKIRQEFTPVDVEIPAVRNLMTSVVVKGKPLMIDPRAFIHPSHHSHLMGYDKLPDNFSVEEIKKAMAAEDEQRKD